VLIEDLRVLISTNSRHCL